MINDEKKDEEKSGDAISKTQAYVGKQNFPGQGRKRTKTVFTKNCFIPKSKNKSKFASK